jgi:hypothetical protein
MRHRHPGTRQSALAPRGAGGLYRLALVLLSVTVGLLSAVACTSSDADGDASGVGAAGRDGPRRTTSTTVTETQPSAGEPAAIRPYVEDLLARYDAVVTDLVAEPQVARDDDHPAVVELRSLFEPDSEFVEGSLAGWQANADAGIVLLPVSDGELVTVSHLEGDPTATSEDVVVFARCVEQSFVRIEDGQQTDRVVGRVLPGEGTAVLVDGRWLLRHLSTPRGSLGCATAGSVTV